MRVAQQCIYLYTMIRACETSTQWFERLLIATALSTVVYEHCAGTGTVPPTSCSQKCQQPFGEVLPKRCFASPCLNDTL
eukprot:16964-Heterococcus_DN1.PRE.2